MIDFVGVGVTRCGTTWTTRNLKQHPALHIPKKEAKYFSDDDYLTAISRAKVKAGLFGEWTPTYFTHPKEVAKRILDCNPKAKILINLRNPVERAWSWFNERSSKGDVKPGTDFWKLFTVDRPGNEYRIPGYYDKFLLKWFDSFPMEQIHVSLFDQISSDPATYLNDVCRFLGVIRRFKPGNLLRVDSASASNPMPAKVRNRLKKHYSDSIKRTGRLLKREFGFKVEWK